LATKNCRGAAAGAAPFLWPTVTRVGFEAQALSYFSHGTEGSTGLASPKRYLWDTDPRHHAWRFNPGPEASAATAARSRPAPSSVICAKMARNWRRRATGGDRAVFARRADEFFRRRGAAASLRAGQFPGRRYERVYSEAPRRLRRVILTLPTAMPLAERKLFTRRVNTAIRLTWRALGLDESQAPEPFMQWDEATGTQIVFLYNEIKHNFQGDAALFFQVFGRVREGYGETPCLRLASIDIGGGTTDLIITTYQLEGGTAVGRPGIPRRLQHRRR
jgi:hypothetical protein